MIGFAYSPRIGTVSARLKSKTSRSADFMVTPLRSKSARWAGSVQKHLVEHQRIVWISEGAGVEWRSGAGFLMSHIGFRYVSLGSLYFSGCTGRISNHIRFVEAHDEFRRRRRTILEPFGVQGGFRSRGCYWRRTGGEPEAVEKPAGGLRRVDGREYPQSATALTSQNIEF